MCRADIEVEARDRAREVEQQTRTVEARNRGAVEDYWDKGIELPHWMTGWYSDKPMRIGAMLLVCVGLLSVEWLTRKLLKLA